MTNTETIQTVDIQAIGNFLATYHSDLTYIRNFQKYNLDGNSEFESPKGGKGTFYQFVIDFRVARNFRAGTSSDILIHTKKWLKNSKFEKHSMVDELATSLKEKRLTHEKKQMTSLASKILFLNDPWKILPIDTLAKRTFEHESKSYHGYLEKTEAFKSGKKSIIEKGLQIVKPLTDIIEEEFKNDIKDIQIVRVNRFIDKLLWTEGNRN